MKATHHSPAHVNSLDLPAAAASQEAPLAAPNSERTAPARSSLAQPQATSGTKSGKLKVPAIKAPDVTVPIHSQQPANASRTSAPAVQAGAHASTHQQPSATGKNSRVAAPGSDRRRQPGGGNKGGAPAANRGAPLPSPSQQQTSNRSTASGVSKAAPRPTSTATPGRHRQSKARARSSQAHSRSKIHSSARPAAQKQPPAAAGKIQSQTAAQRFNSRTALLSSGVPSSNAQPAQPGQGPSGPMSYVKAARSGVPQEQDHLLVMGRVPMDSLVSPYVPSKRDSAEQKRAKKQVYESLVELATGQHQIISCWRIAGKLHWSCCLVYSMHTSILVHIANTYVPLIYCRLLHS